MDLLINNTKSTEDVYNDLLNTDSSTESLNHNTNDLNFDDFILNEWSTNNDFLITQDITNNNCMSTTTTTNNNNQFTFNNTEISNLIHRTNSLSNSDNDSDSGVCSVSSKSFDSPEISNYNDLNYQSNTHSTSSIIELDDSNDSINQTIIDNNLLELPVNTQPQAVNQINDQLMLIDSAFYNADLSNILKKF
jgi:hypothetical protein